MVRRVHVAAKQVVEASQLIRGKYADTMAVAQIKHFFAQTEKLEPAKRNLVSLLAGDIPGMWQKKAYVAHARQHMQDG